MFEMIIPLLCPNQICHKTLKWFCLHKRNHKKGFYSFEETVKRKELNRKEDDVEEGGGD